MLAQPRVVLTSLTAIVELDSDEREAIALTSRRLCAPSWLTLEGAPPPCAPAVRPSSSQVVRVRARGRRRRRPAPTADVRAWRGWHAVRRAARARQGGRVRPPGSACGLQRVARPAFDSLFGSEGRRQRGHVFRRWRRRCRTSPRRPRAGQAAAVEAAPGGGTHGTARAKAAAVRGGLHLATAAVSARMRCRPRRAQRARGGPARPRPRACGRAARGGGGHARRGRARDDARRG